MAPRDLSPTYASGTDYAVEVAGLRFDFSSRDFAERVGAAAALLGVVPRRAQGPGEIADLVALAAHGRIDRPESGLAAHVERHAPALLGGGEDLVHWLRRLVFRGAWLDRQVTDGLLEPVFEQGRGFTYRSARTGAPTHPSSAPDWSGLAYGAAA